MPALQIANEDGHFVLSWSDPDFALEFTNSLTEPDWQPVESGNTPFTLPNAGPSAFYRLKQ